LSRPDTPATIQRVLEDVALRQAGVITREQAIRCGLTDEGIEANVTAHRWRRIFRSVYATFSGPLPRPTLLWAVVLRAGRGAMLSHETAAELLGLTDKRSPRIHVTVPAERTPDPIAGVVIHRSRRASAAVHPTRTPPQTRVEETVLDLTQTARGIEDAFSWLARAVGARLTTAARLSSAMAHRRRLRWRRLIDGALRDVAVGCHSVLELMYYRDVERAHRLPRADRQSRLERLGRIRYDDVHYRRYGTVVELDGQAAHPDPERFRDMRRDNATVVASRRVLRYGTGDVASTPCSVAAEVASVLQDEGWTGSPQRCTRPDCVIA